MKTFADRVNPTAANLVIIALVLLFYKSGIIPAFSFLSDETLRVLTVAALLYGGISLFFAFISKEIPKKSKGQLTLELIRDAITRKKPTEAQRLASLVVLVKAYFLPIMTDFMIANWSDIMWHATGLLTFQSSTAFIPLVIATFFFIDVAYFVFGYAVDHPYLKNTFRSVDNTFLGWGSAIICYPPFNGSVVALIGWYGSDSASFVDPTLSYIAGGVAVALFLIYLSATIALGAKCSNLTNRGIVSRGPYAFVRHPAYAAKNAAWIISVIPLWNPIAFVSVALWAGIYGVRAYTEERHLSKDPDYVAYKAKVKWLFIPYVW